MPSEIGRLIYGYLYEQCGEALAEQFLDTSDSMRECRLLKRRHAKNFHHRVQDLSLEDILGQYSVLCSLIFKSYAGGDEEPVHRDVLALLRKLLGSRLGPSAAAARSGHLRKPSESRRNSAVDAPPSPAARDFGSDALRHGDSVPVDDGLGGAPETAPATEAESAPALDSASLERRERRICAIFDECAADGRKRPFPSAQYCTPRKQNVGLVCGSKTPTAVMKSIENVGKNRSPAAGRNATAPPTKSVERSSKKDAGCAKDAGRQSETGGQKEKLVRRASRSTPSKSPSRAVPVYAVATSAASSSTVAASTMAVAASSSTMATAASTSSMAAAASTSTMATAASTHRITAPIEEPFKSITSAFEAARPVASVHPTSAAAATVPSVSPKTSAIITTAPMPVETPAMVASTETPATIASAETIFGDLSFESDCSARLDQSASNPTSDGESAAKEPLPEDQRTTGNTDTIFSPVVSPAASEVAVSPIPISRRAEVSKVTPAADSGDAAILRSSTKDLPWDLKLRLYSDHDSTLAAVSKRKPKELRSRKQKEAQKKRKHNDSVEDDPTVAKRFKSGTSTSRQQTVVSGSAEANQEVDPQRAASRRHRRSTEGTFEVDKEKLKKAKDSESKATASIARAATSMRDMIDLGDAAAEKANAGKVEKVSFVEKRLHQSRRDEFVKMDAHRLWKDPITKADGGSARSSSKPRVPAEPTNSSKIAQSKKPIAGEVINLTEITHSEKKGERSEERGAAKKKPKDEVVEKIQPQKEPKLVPVKRKRSLSPGEIVSPELVCYESLERAASPEEMLICHERLGRDTQRDDDVDLGASEMPGARYQLSIGEKSKDMEDFGNEEDQEYDMVLELSTEFELYSRVSQYQED